MFPRSPRGGNWPSSTSIDVSWWTRQPATRSSPRTTSAPGNAAIVHHVIAFVVDPPRGRRRHDQRAIMQALTASHRNAPDGPASAGPAMASTSAVPVTWAPGQGSSNTRSAWACRSSHRQAGIQVHYNLADRRRGKTDSTAVQLRFADSVAAQLRFLLPDPFLERSAQRRTPDSLPPGQRDTEYTWTRTVSQLGVKRPGGGSGRRDAAHAPARSPPDHAPRRRQLRCASHLENWNFHWQEFYFYKKPIAHHSRHQIQVTCDYNTSGTPQAVLPGWGTRNEMCLAVLMVALPAQ